MARTHDEAVAHSIKAMTVSQLAPHWDLIVEWLEIRLAERRAANDDLEGVNLSKSQGRAQELRDILKHIGEASGRVAAMQQNRGK